MTNRVEELNKKYVLAKDGLQITENEFSVRPYFWSIYKDNTVRVNEVSGQAVADRPLFIISAVVSKHLSRYGSKITHISCYRNLALVPHEYYSNIPLTKWRLSNLKIWEAERVDAAVFENINNPNENFSFHYTSGTPFHSVQTLWHLFVELDEHCNTKKEAELYFDYFLKKLELENANLTIEEFKKIVDDQRDLIKQYKQLLERIEHLVNKT